MIKITSALCKLIAYVVGRQNLKVLIIRESLSLVSDCVGGLGEVGELYNSSYTTTTH